MNVVALYQKWSPTTLEHGGRRFWHTWGETYVRRLFEGFKRNWKGDWTDGLPRLILVTDDADMPLPFGVERVTLPLSPEEAPGWWAKVALFKPGLLPAGKTLYLDLDNVVCGDLRPMLELEPDPIIMTDDVAVPQLRNGSTMLIHPERLSQVWHQYKIDPADRRRWFSLFPHCYDQAYIAHMAAMQMGQTAPVFQSLLPSGFMLSSQQLEAGADTSKTALVFGQSVPKPHESTHPFYAQHWRD